MTPKQYLNQAKHLDALISTSHIHHLISGIRKALSISE